MLTILNKITKQEVYYEYEDIYEGMKDVDRNTFFKQLYERSKAGSIEASCTCIPEKHIPLVVSKNKNTYYVKRQDALIEHSPSCKFDGNYTLADNGWNLSPSGDVFVYLQDRMFSMFEYQNPKVKSTIDLDEFLKRFLGYSFETQTKQAVRFNRTPMQFERYFHWLYFFAEKIKLSDYTTLKDIMGYSKALAYELLKKRQRMFLLLLFESKKMMSDKDYLIQLRNPGHEYLIEMICEKKMWDDSYERMFKPVGSPIIVGAFVELKKNSPLVAKKISTLQLSLGGAVASNVYERKLFNKLYLKNRHFVYSYETFSGFNENEPDVLLLDTNPYKAIEIFDSEDAVCLEKKQTKINFLRKELGYNVQVWDAMHKERLYFI